MNDASDGVTKLNVIVSNRVAADDAAFRFSHLRKAAANYLFENLRIAFVGKTYNGKRGNGFTAHGVNITQRVRRRDLSESVWVIHNRRKEIDRLHHCHFRAK